MSFSVLETMCACLSMPKRHCYVTYRQITTTRLKRSRPVPVASVWPVTRSLVTRPNINCSWGRRPWRESDRCRPPVGTHEQRPFDIHIGVFGLAGGRGRQPSVLLLRLLFDFFPLLLLLECYRYYLLYFGRTCSRHAIHSLIELNIMTLITPCRSLSIVSPGLPAPPRFASSFRFRLNISERTQDDDDDFGHGYVFHLFSPLSCLCAVDVYYDLTDCRTSRTGIVISIVRFRQTADKFYQHF